MDFAEAVFLLSSCESWELLSFLFPGSNVIDVGGVVVGSGPGDASTAALVETTPAKDLTEDVGKSILEVPEIANVNIFVKSVLPMNRNIFFSSKLKSNWKSLPIRHDVNDGVEGGIEVANPEEDGYDNVRTRTIGVPTNGHCQVPGKEGQPAQQERPHHDAQSDEGLVLLPPWSVDAVTLSQSCKSWRETKRKHLLTNSI